MVVTTESVEPRCIKFRMEIVRELHRCDISLEQTFSLRLYSF